jgi:hypothetical protein
MRKSQLNTSDSLLPPSKLPMNLIKEEGKSQNRKRAFPEMDFREWEITCRKFCPRRGKQNDNSDKKSRQQASKPKELPSRICYKCRQPGHYANTCPNPRLNKPRSQRQGSKASKSHQNKKSNIQVKQDHRNFVGSVSSWEHLSLVLPSIVSCEPFPVDYWWYYLCPWCPKLSLLAISLSRSCLTSQSWTSSSWSCSRHYEHIKHE